MSAPLIVVLVLFVWMIVVLAKTTLVVPQQSVAIIERLGVFLRSASPGFHILLPFIDRVRKRVFLADQELAVACPVSSKDNVTFSAEATLIFAISDPEKSVYGVSDLSSALRSLIETTIKQMSADLDSMDFNGKLRGLERTILASLEQSLAPWGVTPKSIRLVAIKSS